MNLQQIFDNTDFVHASGTKEELQVAEYLKMQCENAGVTARLEGSSGRNGRIKDAHLYADGEELTCKAFTCCGSGNVEGELYYMPGTDAVSIAGAKDEDRSHGYAGHWIFYLSLDLDEMQGQKPFFSSMANMYYPQTDIDQRDLREAVVGEERKVFCAMLHSSEAGKTREKWCKADKIRN